MNLWRSIAGIVEVEITGADIARCFSAVTCEEISIFRVQSVSDLTVRLWIYRKDYRKLLSLCEKRGETVKLRKRKGIYWTGKRLFGRPILSAGIVCLLTATLMIPRYVFFVEVTGNETVPDHSILEAASRCGIGFGATRREVRSEKVKNALLSEVPELQWAGVNTRGCVAVISVRERAETEMEAENHRVSSIVASQDGVIVSCTATRGNLLCVRGQAVRAGEVLISGYTDCGISIQATRAQGEVYAQTMRQMKVITPSQWACRMSEGKKKYKVSLLIEKKRINLWKDSGISDVTCGRMYKEYYVTLPGGFRLPIALCVETVTDWETASCIIESVDEMATEFAREYLTGQMVAGSILQASESLETEDNCYVLRGSYVCHEMIGREKSEKMGEENEQTD